MAYKDTNYITLNKIKNRREQQPKTRSEDDIYKVHIKKAGIFFEGEAQI